MPFPIDKVSSVTFTKDKALDFIYARLSRARKRKGNNTQFIQSLEKAIIELTKEGIKQNG